MMLLRVILPWVLFLRACMAQQDLMERLPKCAVACFEATLPMTECSPTDLSCMCADTPFLTAAAGCNSLNCTVVQLLQATNETYAACGVPVRDQGAAMIGTTAAFGATALLMVIARLLDRTLSEQAQLGWDDALIGLAGISSVAQNIPVIAAGHIGFGKDMWAMTPSEITESLHWLWFAYPLYMTTEAFCQASILAFYIRIITDKNTRIVVWSLVGLVGCFGIANFFSMVFQCWPIPFFWAGWDGSMTYKSKINMNLFSFIRGGIEIAIDLIILILPLPTLSKLQMSMKKKLQIMSMFCVGFVITGVSCARLHALIQFAATSNPTYDNTPGVYWCMIESNLFIIVACMPAIRAIVHKTYSNHIRSTNGYDNSGKGSYFSGSGGRQKSGGSLPFGTISKSTDVKVYHSNRSDRSESDVELVDRPGVPGHV